MNPFTAISPPTNHHEEVSLPCSRFLDVTQRSPKGVGGALCDIQKTAVRETTKKSTRHHIKLCNN